ncbi:MAG TPA: hypothetical protein VFE02_12075 [Candidatus Acidoferrales bacterium]|jgi:hypothetical protein|nr:hypothetical protein [Candidatus Acidoferrales bacterium]
MKAALQYFQIHLSFALSIGIALAMFHAASAAPPAYAADDDTSLLQADRMAFGPGNSWAALNDGLLDAQFTWTDAAGETLNKSTFLKNVRSWNNSSLKESETVAHVHGQVGIIQEHSDKTYVLRVWIRGDSRWRLLVYQAVLIGVPPANSGGGPCKNPCIKVPFHPRNADQRDVIHAYQAVERAVTAHNSAEWGAHIADEFFAVTSNSDRPVDKRTRMAGLDDQKVGGIAPFPLVSARMFEFGDVMIMTSRQQPAHGLPLHVTRIWFKRDTAWLEAYSYQTTIQGNVSAATVEQKPLAGSSLASLRAFRTRLNR